MHKPAPQCKLKRDLERQYDFKPVYAGGPYNLGTSSEFSKAMTKAFKKAGVHVDGHETRCIDRYRDYAWVATVNKEKSFQDGWEAQARAERPATSEEELRRREADTKQFIQESAFVIAQRAKSLSPLTIASTLPPWEPVGAVGWDGDPREDGVSCCCGPHDAGRFACGLQTCIASLRR